MAVKKETVDAVVSEMNRLRDAILRLFDSPEWKRSGKDYGMICGNKESGAVRRASMDLTRALADLRRRG